MNRFICLAAYSQRIIITNIESFVFFNRILSAVRTKQSDNINELSNCEIHDVRVCLKDKKSISEFAFFGRNLSQLNKQRKRACLFSVQKKKQNNQVLFVDKKKNDQIHVTQVRIY